MSGAGMTDRPTCTQDRQVLPAKAPLSGQWLHMCRSDGVWTQACRLCRVKGTKL